MAHVKDSTRIPEEDLVPSVTRQDCQYASAPIAPSSELDSPLLGKPKSETPLFARDEAPRALEEAVHDEDGKPASAVRARGRSGHDDLLEPDDSKQISDAPLVQVGANPLEEEPVLALDDALLEVKAGRAGVVSGVVDDLLVLPLRLVVPCEPLGAERADHAGDGDEEELGDKGERDDAAWNTRIGVVRTASDKKVKPLDSP